MSKPKDQHIAHARQLLEAGYLPSALPELLMAEFNLPPAQARPAAAAAMRERGAEAGAAAEAERSSLTSSSTDVTIVNGKKITKQEAK